MDMGVTAFDTQRLRAAPAQACDLPELEVLEVECDRTFQFDPADEHNHRCTIAECLTQGDLPPGGTRTHYFFFTLREADVLVGFFAFYLGYPHPRTAYLSILYIAERHRRRGLAAEVLRPLREHLAALGMQEMRLHVSLRNITGLRFWVQNGFTHITKIQGSGILLPGTFGGLELRAVLEE